MRLWLIIALSLVLLNGATVASPEAPRVAVLGFSGDSRNQVIVAGAFTSLAAARLVNSRKFEVMKPEVTERTVASGGGVGALGSTAAVSEFGNALGCQYVVYGSVLGADVSTSRFSGYGVTSFKTNFGLRVDFKILNVFDGKVVFSRILEESEVKVNLNNPEGFSAPLFAELSKRAITGLEAPMLNSLERNIQDSAPALKRFLEDAPGATPGSSTAQPTAKEAQKVTLRFDCSVPNASVEIDGIIEGVCSEAFPVSVGLHEISIKARNYETFKTKVRLTKDTIVPVDLIVSRPSKK